MKLTAFKIEQINISLFIQVCIYVSKSKMVHYIEQYEEDLPIKVNQLIISKYVLIDGDFEQPRVHYTSQRLKRRIAQSDFVVARNNRRSITGYYFLLEIQVCNIFSVRIYYTEPRFNSSRRKTKIYIDRPERKDVVDCERPRMYWSRLYHECDCTAVTH